MYLLATTTKYQNGIKYYSKSGNTYTLLVAGTDYTIGSTITGTVYEMAEYDRLYIRPKGNTGAFSCFPYIVNSVNTLPEHDAGQNDVDLDAYTNTQGYTIRNRVRHDVKTLDFKIETMTGQELKDFLTLRSPVWFETLFFDESAWAFVTKTMYCSSPKYHKYYMDKTNPLKNIYTDVSFGFVEE